MEFKIAKPSLFFSKFIKNYWAINNCDPINQPHHQRIVPSGLFELIFYLGSRPVSENKGKSIQFKPAGLSMFLDIPISELNNQNVPLKYLTNTNIEEIESRLYEAKSFNERIQIIEYYLLNLFQKNKNQYNYNRLEHSITIINQLKGIVDIDNLASAICLSRKQFERLFSYYIGTSPKKFLKTIRFQHAISRKSNNKSLNLVDLTYSCGYYDQSHMINDFQQLSGTTPKQYFSICEPYSDYFQ